MGLKQGPKAPALTLLRLHSNVLLSSVPVKAKFAVVWFVGSNGMPVRVVSGGAVSTDQLKAAGLASTLPAASMART